MTTGLRVEDLSKSYGATLAVSRVSFSVPQGEIVALLGPSGCGKSTLLHLIAGLEQGDQGVVFWSDRALTGVPPHRRQFGLMFQDFALFPHLDVAANTGFGLRMVGQSGTQITSRVKEILDFVGLTGFEHRDVNTLSGGEQQRVALARALAPEPRLLMLDEPLGSLDRALRSRLVLELRSLLKKLKQTALYVTHDQEEAFALADRVILLNAGRIVQEGTPQELYRQPDSPFAARFFGLTNLVPGEINQIEGRNLAQTALGNFPAPDHMSGAVLVLIRPDMADPGDRLDCVLQGTIHQRRFQGHLCRVVVEVDGIDLEFDFPARAELPEEGATFEFSFSSRTGLQFYPPEN